MTEWRPIPDYPSYQVSDDGQVRGINPAGRLLKQNWTGHPGPRWRVTLYAAGKRRDWHVHVLVARAFIGPPHPDTPFVRHLNDDPHDNRAANLAYGTRIDNARDALRNGRNANANKTSCLRGHPLDAENTYTAANGRRSCQECRRAALRASHARARDRQGRAPRYRCAVCRRTVGPDRVPATPPVAGRYYAHPDCAATA